MALLILVLQVWYRGLIRCDSLKNDLRCLEYDSERKQSMECTWVDWFERDEQAGLNSFIYALLS